MTPEQTMLVKTTGDSVLPIAGPDGRSGLEASMSYAMITIGTGVGHLAAAIFSALAYGLRVLFAPARASEREHRLVGARVRSRASLS
jgi:hypothetical protein